MPSPHCHTAAKSRIQGALCCALLLLTSTTNAVTFEKSLDPCAVKKQYEAAEKAAKEAEARAASLPLPPTLRSRGIIDREKAAHKDLFDLKQMIENHKSNITVNGHIPTLAEAQQALAAAKKNGDANGDIDTRLNQINADMAAASGALNRLRAKPEYKQLGAIIAIKKTIAAQENAIRADLPDVPLDDTAQVRSAAQKVEIVTPKIEEWSRKITELQQVDTANNRYKIDQFKELIAAEYEKERQGLLTTITNWSSSKGELAKLDPKGDLGDLYEEIQQHQKTLNDRTAEKARLIASESTANNQQPKKISAHTAEFWISTLQQIETLQKQKLELDTWLQAQKDRKTADDRRTQAGADYLKALQAKDELLDQAKAAHQAEEARIAAIKATLAGKPRTVQFVEKLRDLRDHALNVYKPLKTRLDKFDCYLDANRFNQETLTPRIRTLEKLTIPAPGTTAPKIARTTPKTPTKPATPKPIEWVRQPAVITSKGTAGRKPLNLAVTENSLTYSITVQGQSYTNTMTWETPPAVIRPDTPITLSMNSTNQPGYATVYGQWNISNFSEVGGTNEVYSHANQATGKRRDSPHEAKWTVKAYNTPTIEASGGHDPMDDSWVWVKWEYKLRQ